MKWLCFLAFLAVSSGHAGADDGKILLENAAIGRQEIQDPVRLDIRRAGDSTSSTLALEIVFHMSPDVYVYRAKSLFFRIEETDTGGLGAVQVDMPEAVIRKNFDGSTVQVFTDGQKIVVHRPITSADQWRYAGYVQYQACNRTTCFMPKKRMFLFSSDPADTVIVVTAGEEPDEGRWEELSGAFTVAGKAAGFLSPGQFMSFLDDPRDGGGTNAFAGQSLWLVAVLALIGGFLLNLTPCVLPMIPITVAVIGAGAQAGTRRRGFLLGGIYGLGMSVAYGILGLLVVLSGAKFGAVNSSPLFNIVIAVVFTLLALAMFDIVHIDFTRFRAGIGGNRQGKGNMLVVFTMGIIAALLAGACVAPVVISAVLYATTLYSEGRPIGLALPFLLGVGMAMPWPFAGAGLSFLPKPGKWMTWVKYVFGVVILVVALQYGYTGVKLWRGAGAKETGAEEQSTLGWHSSLVKGLTLGIDEQRPVLVDFWATWCKNCLVMDATTFKDARVQERLGEYVLVKYRAEDPQDPVTKQVLDHFGIMGLPTYVILAAE